MTGSSLIRLTCLTGRIAEVLLPCTIHTHEYGLQHIKFPFYVSANLLNDLCSAVILPVVITVFAIWILEFTKQQDLKCNLFHSKHPMVRRISIIKSYAVGRRALVVKTNI